MSQTMAEQLFEQGVERGIEQGKTQVKQADVLKILRLRFHAVPESITNEISLMRNLSRLDALLEQAVTAKSLNDIDLQ